MRCAWRLAANRVEVHALSGGLLLVLQGGLGYTTIPSPNAAVDAEFTRVAAIRELDDGRVLVADAGAKTLHVTDFRTRSASVIGREGDGPGEYRSLTALHALSGDSTLLVDVVGSRWLVLHGATIVRTLTSNEPAVRLGSRTPLGADTVGHVLASRQMGSLPAGSPAAMPQRMDSSYLLRVHRATGRADTVAALQLRRARIQSQHAGGQITSINITTNPMASGDHATAFADGTVAIARVNPYRVDWHFPDGRVVNGPRLPYVEIPLDIEERRGVMLRQAQRNGGRPQPPETIVDWPDVMPPFLQGAALPGPDGGLWIRRTPSTSAPDTRYDVVDRRGRLVRRVTMPAHEQIIGFGRTAVYTLSTDDNGIQRLRRHDAR